MPFGLHQYESWLTEQIDPFMQISGKEIHLTFGDVVSIDISSCKSLDSILPAAWELRRYLEIHKCYEEHSSLPEKYLFRRFSGLIISANQLQLTTNDIVRYIDDIWGGYDWQRGWWRS